jgi:hypothetical protein
MENTMRNKTRILTALSLAIGSSVANCCQRWLAAHWKEAHGMMGTILSRGMRAPASRRPSPCLVAPHGASFQLSSEVRRSTPTKNKRVKPIHIANHKFCQESGNSRTVAKVAATIIAKPVDVMKRIVRRTRRSRSCKSPLCMFAKRASVPPLPSAF